MKGAVMDHFGWLLLVVTVGLVAALGVALAYGARQTYRRRRDVGLSREQANDPGWKDDPAYGGDKPGSTQQSHFPPSVDPEHGRRDSRRRR